MASLSQGRTAAAQCGLFTHKSVPVIFEVYWIKLKTARETRHPCSKKSVLSIIMVELYFIYRNWHICQCLPTCGPRCSWWMRGYSKCPENWHYFSSSLAAPSTTLIFLLYCFVIIIIIIIIIVRNIKRINLQSCWDCNMFLSSCVLSISGA